MIGEGPKKRAYTHLFVEHGVDAVLPKLGLARFVAVGKSDKPSGVYDESGRPQVTFHGRRARSCYGRNRLQRNTRESDSRTTRCISLTGGRTSKTAAAEIPIGLDNTGAIGTVQRARREWLTPEANDYITTPKIGPAG